MRMWDERIHWIAAGVALIAVVIWLVEVAKVI